MFSQGAWTAVLMKQICEASPMQWGFLFADSKLLKEGDNL